jgi:hypothetical protein
VSSFFVPLTKYLSDQLKENEKGEESSTYGGDAYRFFDGET